MGCQYVKPLTGGNRSSGTLEFFKTQSYPIAKCGGWNILVDSTIISNTLRAPATRLLTASPDIINPIQMMISTQCMITLQLMFSWIQKVKTFCGSSCRITCDYYT